ncbi:MAG: acyltransferase [Proteobacteria bacterium]|nr:acyltransferase [Pseudomonadota bacterium]
MSQVDVQPAVRIDALDGLRGVAVLAVIGYHFFSRWTLPLNPTNLYPYGDWLAGVAVLRYGYFGVHLFFLVSGFVISLTLQRCATWREFAVRRAARLVPSMVLAAVATYLIVSLVAPHYWTPKACNFLPSLTFTDPLLYERAFGLHCDFMDGAYWSLWVEVRFYVWAALLYYAVSAKHFLRNCAWLAGAALVVFVFEQRASHIPGIGLADLVFFPAYAPWLLAGVGFFHAWMDRGRVGAWFLVAVGLLFGLVGSAADFPERLVVLGIYAVFTVFVLRLRIASLLAASWLTRVGAASYALYLLHQEIGVTLIAALARALGIEGRPSTVVALAVILGLIAASAFIYDRYEVPARRLLTRVGGRFFRSTRLTASVG